MSSLNLHIVILAAGQGTRMRSKQLKVLQPLGGRPMLAHVLDTARALSARAYHVVYGHGAELVREWFEGAHPGDDRLRWVLQEEQKGTGHAVLQALPEIPDNATVLVLYGDVPLVRAVTLEPLIRYKGLGLLTATLPKPRGYGRILRDEEGAIMGIVEDDDANAEQRRIREINTGMLVAPARLLKRWLPKLSADNAKHEFYLTDIVSQAVKDGVEVTANEVEDNTEITGINDPAQLAGAERAFQRRQAEQLMRHGLMLRDPSRFDLRGMLRHGSDVIVDVDVVLEGDVHLGDGVYIGPFSLLKNATLGPGTRIEAHSVLESVVVGKHCRIGPFARLRPETTLSDEIHIGNFVEIKKTHLGTGSKVNHLSYLGDTTVGERVNIGAGTITCNYDGANKHKTVIEDDVSIGSDTQLVAPVKVGRGATIGAGSTIAEDVPPGGLTVCRAREQKTLPDWKRPVKKKREA
ncbi:MAG: bifunctional UDP-N-acetylglucosamine diphosphorylase/glucosamine-1-phosphate N-acetyltransferase GlmU [Nevskiales bacterium]|nr:bifunctional UDP-N-acetylglucosamine diphosphorylase/glucosamine-1-phosphate N-acetyltransferase GlmU [Nevskiales bacterium]